MNLLSYLYSQYGNRIISGLEESTTDMRWSFFNTWNADHLAMSNSVAGLQKVYSSP